MEPRSLSTVVFLISDSSSCVFFSDPYCSSVYRRKKKTHHCTHGRELEYCLLVLPALLWLLRSRRDLPIANDCHPQQPLTVALLAHDLAVCVGCVSGCFLDESNKKNFLLRLLRYQKIITTIRMGERPAVVAYSSKLGESSLLTHGTARGLFVRAWFYRTQRFC